MEQEARRKINELTGFGVYAPFTVSFDQLIDLDEVKRRHRDDGDFRTMHFSSSRTDSPDYLQPVRLEVGHGRFPQDLDRDGSLFPE